MAKLAIQTQRDFEIAADWQTVWEYLCDTPKTVAHYPKIHALEPLGEDQWCWKLQEIGAAGFSHQIVYAVQYLFDESAGSIVWEPLHGHGNSVIQGSFLLQESGDSTVVVLETSGELEIPVPRLLKRMALPFVEQEFQSHIEKFASNLQKAIG